MVFFSGFSYCFVSFAPTPCPLILLRPYQCSQSRIIEMLRQGVRGSDLFRVIFSSGIPMPFWLK